MSFWGPSGVLGVWGPKRVWGRDDGSFWAPSGGFWAQVVASGSEWTDSVQGVGTSLAHGGFSGSRASLSLVVVGLEGGGFGGVDRTF